MQVFQLFKTSEDKAQAVELMKQLYNHPSWQIIVKVQEANVAYLVDRLIEGKDEAGELLDKEQENRIRAKIQAYKETMNTPSWLHQQLNGEPLEGENELVVDPYPTVESMYPEESTEPSEEVDFDTPLV